MPGSRPPGPSRPLPRSGPVPLPLLWCQALFRLGSLGGRLRAGKCHQICICFLLSPRGAVPGNALPHPEGQELPPAVGQGPCLPSACPPCSRRGGLGLRQAGSPALAQGRSCPSSSRQPGSSHWETARAVSLDLLQGQPRGRFRYNLGLKCFDQTTAFESPCVSFSCPQKSLAIRHFCYGDSMARRWSCWHVKYPGRPTARPVSRHPSGAGGLRQPQEPAVPTGLLWGQGSCSPPEDSALPTPDLSM